MNTQEEDVRYATEYAQDDVKYSSRKMSLNQQFRQKVQPRYPNMTFETWLSHVAYLARTGNASFRQETYYQQTSDAYDRAYIAAITELDEKMFPDE